MTDLTKLHKYTFSLTLSIRTPMLQSGLAIPWMGFDSAPLLDQHGRLIVSGDQIEGYLCHLMTVAGACDADIKNWFGKGGQDIDDKESTLTLGGTRANLKIFDLAGPKAPTNYKSYHRIAVDEITGATKSGAWQVIAQSHGARKDLTFSGEGRLFAESDDERDRLIAWITAALEMIPALGAVKSSGFGRLVEPETNKPVCADNSGPVPFAPCDDSGGGTRATQYQVTLSFPYPFLVDHIFHSGNVYDSAEIIPGNVIKAAIADMLTLGGVIGDYSDLLEQLTIRHAFPGGERPLVAPLSLGFDSDGKAHDALNGNGQGLLVFEPDWKSKQRTAAARQYYQPGLSRHVRTRTAVRADNVPKATQLFSQRLVVTKDTKWQTAFVLPAIRDDRTSKLAALVEFLKTVGLARIGKTAVPAEVCGQNVTDQPVIRLSRDGEARITLQTSVWILRPEWLTKDDGTPVLLHDAYAQYFKERLGCELVDFMALQNWVGGPRNVGDKSYLPDAYYPWLLTRAGSVFKVRGLCLDKAKEIARTGLPPAEDRCWQKCTFLPQNGFGEVRIGDADLTTISGMPNVP